LKGTSLRTAALNSRTVRRNPSGLTPSSFEASSSNVSATMRVTRLSPYPEHALAVVDQRYRPRLVEDLDAFFCRGVGQVLHQVRDFRDLLEVLDPVVGEAHDAAGEAAVAAGFLDGRGLQHRHAGALVPCRQRRAQRGVALAGHDDIESLHWMGPRGVEAKNATGSTRRRSPGNTGR
jgi:hypothetical protein